MGQRITILCAKGLEARQIAKGLEARQIAKLAAIRNYRGALRYYDNALSINPNDKFALNTKQFVQENVKN